MDAREERAKSNAERDPSGANPDIEIKMNYMNVQLCLSSLRSRMNLLTSRKLLQLGEMKSGHFIASNLINLTK